MYWTNVRAHWNESGLKLDGCASLSGSTRTAQGITKENGCVHVNVLNEASQ